MTPTSHRVLSKNPRGFHRLHYLQWGESQNPKVLFCVHGLARNARDFDALAAALAHRYRVICPDVAGRGESDWLADPADYHYGQYLTDATVVLAHSRAETVAWLGTSMGGLLGMMMAAQPQSPIERLVLNDVGPWIPQAALERIADYLAPRPTFADLNAVEAHLRRTMTTFGRLTDGQWRHLARHGVHRQGDRYVLHWDPKILDSFVDAIDGDVDLWAVWDAVTCPALVVRGAESDVLPQTVAAEMTQRGPRATGHEVSGVGHAPLLMDEAQWAPVEQWLAAGL
ncbi:MAG: alpha/beta fold hydrolase [Candidatus Competibacterales bacterium]